MESILNPCPRTPVLPNYLCPSLSFLLLTVPLHSLIGTSLSYILSLVIFHMDSQQGLSFAFLFFILLRFYLSECISVSLPHFSFEFSALPRHPNSLSLSYLGRQTAFAAPPPMQFYTVLQGETNWRSEGQCWFSVLSSPLWNKQKCQQPYPIEIEFPCLFHLFCFERKQTGAENGDSSPKAQQWGQILIPWVVGVQGDLGWEYPLGPMTEARLSICGPCPYLARGLDSLLATAFQFPITQGN